MSFDFKDSSGICISFNSTGNDNIVPETAKLCGPMRTVRVGGTARFSCAADRRRCEPIGYRLVRTYQQGLKEHHHVDTCRQEDQVCTGFFDGLEARATDHVDRL